MRPHLVVSPAPILNDHRGFRPGAKPFHGEAFVPEFAVEAFDHPVLPGFSQASIGKRKTAHTPCAATVRVAVQTPPAGVWRVRLPFFCGDFLHDLDLEVPLGQEPLEPGVLLLHPAGAGV